jgi:hypothetical protein
MRDSKPDPITVNLCYHASFPGGERVNILSRDMWYANKNLDKPRIVLVYGSQFLGRIPSG